MSIQHADEAAAVGGGMSRSNAVADYEAGLTRRKWLIIVARILVGVALIALWHISSGWLIDKLFVSSPEAVSSRLWKWLVDGTLWNNLSITLKATAYGFAIGSAIGFVLGLLFGRYRAVAEVFDPYITALYSIPKIALAPLFIIWFGLGLGSKVAVGVSLTFFIVLTSTVAGGRGVNPDHITLARTLGASESQIFRKFVLPSAVPVIFNGLRLGLVFALLGVIGAEIIASEHGLGQTLQVLASSFKTSGVFAIIILLSLIGVGISWGMTSLENRLLRWR